MREGNGKGSIIVVDDEQAVRDVVARTLQGEGYDVVTASSGKEALQKVTHKNFDLMFLDIRMPGINGMNVLSRMKTEHPATTVVMLTAVSSMSAMMEANRNEAFLYLTKPCELTEIVSITNKILGNRE